MVLESQRLANSTSHQLAQVPIGREYRRHRELDSPLATIGCVPLHLGMLSTGGNVRDPAWLIRSLVELEKE